MLMIIIPIFVSGTLKERSSKINLLKRTSILIFDVLFALFEPIRLRKGFLTVFLFL